MTKTEKSPIGKREAAARDAARGYTDADLAEAMDNPEWTDEQLRAAEPFEKVFPHLRAAAQRARKTEPS